MPVPLRKATHTQLRRDNRQLLLRAVYAGLANSRADLAHETGLAKPTVSQLIKALIDDGFLIESGLGHSTDEGGKRPRLLDYVPDARLVIGLSLTTQRITGVLANLDGQVSAHHYVELIHDQNDQSDILLAICETINGLIAQLTAPLLCLSIGVPGAVDSRLKTVLEESQWGWRNFPLGETLRERYSVPVYVANSTELAAMGQYAFGSPPDSIDLVTILIEDSVGVGLAFDGGAHHSGGEIGRLRLAPCLTTNENPGTHVKMLDELGAHLSWARVRLQIEAAVHVLYPDTKLLYLHLRQAISDRYPQALALQDELAGYLSPVFVWVIALLRPDHIALVGPIADLGEPFLRRVFALAGQLIDPALLQTVTVSLESAADRAAIGAVAFALQQELGLI